MVAQHGTEEIEDVSDPKIDLKTGKVVTGQKMTGIGKTYINIDYQENIWSSERNVKQIKSLLTIIDCA